MLKTRMQLDSSIVFEKVSSERIGRKEGTTTKYTNHPVTREFEKNPPFHVQLHGQINVGMSDRVLEYKTFFRIL